MVEKKTAGTTRQAARDAKKNWDDMYLGEGGGATFTMDTSRTQRNNNVLVAGASGTGKTMSLTEPMLLHASCQSYFVTVTKRRIVEKYAPILRERGYDVYDLNMADPSRADAGFDPLHAVKSEADIAYLCRAVIEAGGTKEFNKDRYWTLAATQLLEALMRLARHEKGITATFADVLDLFDTLQLTCNEGESYCGELNERFGRYTHDKRMAVLWNSFYNLPSTNTAPCVMGVLATALEAAFNDKNIRDFMRKRRRFDPKALGSRRSVVFLTTSAVSPAMHSFVSLFYGHLFKELFEYAEDCAGGRLPVPVHVICDDFATGSKVPEFAEMISVFREKGISATLLVQSESQLNNLYGAYNATTIINNCDTYVYLGGSDRETIRSMCTCMDLPFEKVRSLPVGEIYILRRGEKALRTRRYPITEDPLYKRCFERGFDKIA